MGASHLRALVSGLPGHLRASKVLAFLQAFVDDSAAERGDGRLFMAGYINTVANWERFSDDWNAVLRRQPEIDYLRMTEANALDKQFRGWSVPTRDLKLAKLAKVIRRYKPESFHFSVDRAEYLRRMKPVAPRGLASAHYAGTFGVVTIVTRFLATTGFKGKVDFIFDEQSGVSADLALFFDFMAKHLPPEARNLIARVPHHGSDKDYLPLQAADMLAWHLRRQHERGDVERRLNKLFWNEGGHLTSHLGDERIKHFAAAMAAIPGTGPTKSKSGWRRLRGEIAASIARGWIPPAGTKWRNFWWHAKQAVWYWFFNRRRR